MNGTLWRMMAAVGLGLSVLPAPVWAGCEEAPLFSSASTQDVYTTPKTFVVSARKTIPGCPAGELKLTVDGSPGPVSLNHAPGQVSATIYLSPGQESTGIVTYTVTDQDNNTNTVTLPVRFGMSNTTPVLSPISDLVMAAGKTASFTIEVTDRDNNLLVTEDGLRVDGLPASAKKSYKRLSSGDIVMQATLKPFASEIGVYRVLIRGKDNLGAMTIGEMRLEVR